MTKVLTLPLLLLLSLLYGPLAAFHLIPITEDFAPIGPDATKTFTLSNKTNALKAIQVSVVARRQLPDGGEELKDADDDFLVYPA